MFDFSGGTFFPVGKNTFSSPIRLTPEAPDDCLSSKKQRSSSWRDTLADGASMDHALLT